MGEKNIKLGPGKLYFNGEPFAGIAEGAAITEEPEDVPEIISSASQAEFSASCQLCGAAAQEVARAIRDTAALIVIVAAYPTRRVRHLAQFGKNKRIRKKNQSRAVWLLARKEDKYV